MFKFSRMIRYAPENDNQGGGNPGPSPTGGGQGEQVVTMKQSDLDQLFAQRAQQAERSLTDRILKDLGVENLEAAKTALKAKADADEASKTELQKLQDAVAKETERAAKATQERDVAQAQVSETLKRTAVLMAATMAGFNDPSDAWTFIDKTTIALDDKGNASGVDGAIKTLIEKRPYLIKTSQPPKGPGSPPPPKGRSNNQPAPQGTDKPLIRL